jgi:hypothetical protein
MSQTRNNWLLVIITVLVTLFAMEGVLRISGIAKMTARFTCYDPVIGKVYCPQATGTFTKSMYSHLLVINSDGMVDQEYPVAKPKDTLRVALLGDSFTSSEYLPTEYKFEGLLERKLTRLLGKQVELLNFGISGSETWTQLQIFHLKAVKYQPDVTLLALYWGNDIADNVRHLQDNDPNPLQGEYTAPLARRLIEIRKNFNKALWNRSLLYQVVHDGYGHLEQTVKRRFRPGYLRKIDQLTMSDSNGATQRVLSLNDVPRLDTADDDDDLFFWNSAGWNITRKLILKLKAEVEAAGGHLVVMHFPSEGLVRSGIPIPYEQFDEFLDKNDIPHVSLFQDYYSMDSAELRKHFIQNDGHWTRYGHSYVAQKIQSMLFHTLLMR